MITIIVDNNKCRIQASQVRINELYDKFKIRSPGAFWAMQSMGRRWDGFVRYVSDRGYFSTGLLPQVLAYCKEQKYKVELDDNRESFEHVEVPEQLGKLSKRDYQYDAIRAVVDNKVGGIPFPRGIWKEATNAGKLPMAMGLFLSYDKRKRLIFIVNRKHLYEQGLQEAKDFIPNDIGYIGPNGIKYNRFMICMAQTLASKLNFLKATFLDFDIVIADECHYAASKTYKAILNKLTYAYVRIGMSGTPLKHRDKVKNQNILSYFGNVLHETTNKQLIDRGFSTPIEVTINEGNVSVHCKGDYKTEEEKGIVKNKDRNNKGIRRVKYHVKKKRLPLIIMCKYHKHVEIVYRKAVRKFPNLKVDYIHVGVKDRLKRLEKFKKGRTHILVSSLLIKEGKNIPLLQAIVYLGAGDSAITILQTIGRLLRTSPTKSKVYFDDFFDLGAYIRRHSKHRIKEYKTEGFPIKYKVKVR